jgi:beta-galactosidase
MNIHSLRLIRPSIVLVLLTTLPTTSLAAAELAPAHHFGVEGDHFVLDGKRFQIISGELHYERIPREYWRDRLKKARAMGLNTVSTYVFWNVHEPRPGVYNFSDGSDVAAFIRMAQEEGLYVILRPGPYSCAEWDLGGFPAWLLADPNIVLRSTDEKFIAPAVRWLHRLGQELAPLQITRGGPIIAVQVENEYGSFGGDKQGNDKQYLKRILDALKSAGLGEAMLYTADGGDELAAGTLPELPAVVNFGPGDAKEEFAKLQKFRPGQPMMSGEYWDGWFDHWGAHHKVTSAGEHAQELDWILSQGYSINLYMFHGGTSFGFMNGANWDDNRYEPDVTSYDYDSPVGESGVLTEKYFAFRKVIAKHRPGVTLPDPPRTLPVIEILEFELPESASLWANLPAPSVFDSSKNDLPRNMESFGQAYGYILYRTKLKESASGDLVLPELRSYARIFVDGKLVGILDRRKKQDRLQVEAKAGSTLDILVEGTGRINFSLELRKERQGINGAVTLAGKELTGWQVFCLPMDDLSKLQFHQSLKNAPTGPAFYRGHFELGETGDTFLDTRRWGKGAVWINGHALGRFWNLGPQQTLYVPGPWLKKGMNDIVVFSQETPKDSRIRGLRAPVLDELGTEAQ